VQISEKVGVRTQGALGKRESLACQIGRKFKLCTRTVELTVLHNRNGAFFDLTRLHFLRHHRG